MPGAGYTRKPYHINVNKEATFGLEAAVGNQTAISGAIQETPDFTPKFDPIKTKLSTDLGAVNKASKGAFRGNLSWSETIQDWRPLARLLGNTIDMVRIIKGIVIATAGTILTDENVSGDDGAEGYIEQVTIPYDNLLVDVMATGPVTFAGGTATIVRFTSTTVTLSDISVGLGDNVEVTITSNSATFDTNTAVGQLVDIILYQFTKEETLTFVGGAGATATLKKIEGNIMTVVTLTGTIANDDIFTGGTSGARGSVAAAGASPTIPELVPFNLLELIDLETGTMVFTDSSQTSLIYQHQLAVSASQNSYTLNYALDSLNKQHLMTGSILKSLGLESASNDAPKFAEEWWLGTWDPTDTIDAVVDNDHDLYQYTDIVDSINNEVYTDVFKTVSTSFTRSNKAPNDSHQSLFPTGFKGAEVETTLEFGIHREDEVLLALTTGDTRFAANLTFTRGVAGEDDAIITYPTNKMLQPAEAGEETIFLTVPFEVEGTPTAIINDDIADYSS